MKQQLLYSCQIALLIIFFGVSSLSAQPGVVEEGGEPLRVVSLAPSLTEIVYAIGAGQDLVAVSRFCDYPKEAKSLPKVGGYVDPNYEAILSYQPDIILLLGEHGGAEKKLSSLGLETLAASNESLESIFRSVEQIGDALGRKKSALSVVQALRERAGSVEKSKHLRELENPKRVLVTIGGHGNRNGLEKVIVSGRGTIFSELIERTGSVNAYKGTLKYPSLSAEGIMALNPDVILDVIPDTSGRKVSIDEVKRLWQSIPKLSAVQNDRVHIITEEFVVNPGPRIVDTLELFAKLVEQ